MIRIDRYKKLKLDPQGDPHLVQLFSVYDKAANFFNPPYTSTQTPEQELLMMKRSAMSGGIKYPNDLDLYLIGVFDTNSGRLVESNTYLVGSLSVGDFARKVNTNENVQLSRES